MECTAVIVQEKKEVNQCPLCGGQEETIAHILLHCPTLQQTRTTTDHKIKTLLEHFFYQPRSEDELIQAILNSSILAWIPKQAQAEFERVTWRMCFNLPQERSIQLAASSGIASVSANFLKKNKLPLTHTQHGFAWL